MDGQSDGQWGQGLATLQTASQPWGHVILRSQWTSALGKTCPASGVAWGMGAGPEPLGFLCPAELLPQVGHGATFIPAVFAEPLAQPLLLGRVWEPVCLGKPGLVESTFTVS